MLRTTKSLESCSIGATDGVIGHVKDLYFDDDAWVVRYFVVDAGSWLKSRKVLVSPVSLLTPNWNEGILPAAITKDQVRNSPDIDTDKPVSRQNEVQYLGYYGYPYYWGGVGMWGDGLYPYAMVPGYAGYGIDRADREREEESYARTERDRRRNDDPHLRSINAVVGYHIKATDGEIGHVEGLLVDEETWAIRYLIVNTSNWWVGHKVLVAPQWIKDVRWSDETVSVDLSRASVKDAPAYDPEVILDRPWEEGLYRHYRRPAYWAEKASFHSVV